MQKVTIEDIKIGMKVIIKDNGQLYEGHEGVIIDIKRGKEKETENNSELDIYVEVDVNEDEAIDEVIYTEEELGFFLDENKMTDLSVDLNGYIICPQCFKPVKIINEERCVELSWVFGEQGYKYHDNGVTGGSGRTCGECSGRLEEYNIGFFLKHK